MTTELHDTSASDQPTAQQPAAPIDGILLLRDQLLPNLLGEDEAAILYWAGKELARQQPLENESAVIQFFDNHGLGSLRYLATKKETISYILTGPIVTSRLEKVEPSFSLEAGFLAQQHQQVSGMYTEASFEIDRRKKAVHLTVQMDKKSST